MRNLLSIVYADSARTWFCRIVLFLFVSSYSFGNLSILSTRHDLGSEDSNDTIYVDFEISAETDVLFRHVGPHLALLGVPDTLSDAALELFDADEKLIGSNDNWGDAANASEIETVTPTVGGFDLESGSQDSAMLMTLEPGKYRLKVFSDSGATGVSLSEVFVVPPGGGSFRTISVEGFGDSTNFGQLIPGFLTTNGPSSILVRVSGVGMGADPDPSIKIDSLGYPVRFIASNDDWSDGAEADLINSLSDAVGLTPSLIPGSTESAVLLVSLDAGSYGVVNSSSGRVRVDIADVTAEVESFLEPLFGGLPLSGVENWFYSDWFGYYSTAFAPWLFHAQHGAIYRHPESTNASLYVFDHAMGSWCWTNESIYPFVYAFDPPADNTGTDIEAAWLWYSRGTKDPRSFGVVTGPNAGGTLFFNP